VFELLTSSSPPSIVISHHSTSNERFLLTALTLAH
jgi:hypothetical protein